MTLCNFWSYLTQVKLFLLRNSTYYRHKIIDLLPLSPNINYERSPIKSKLYISFNLERRLNWKRNKWEHFCKKFETHIWHLFGLLEDIWTFPCKRISDIRQPCTQQTLKLKDFARHLINPNPQNLHKCDTVKPELATTSE